MSTIDYTRSTAKTVEAAVADLEKALAERKFAVLWHLDVNRTLKEKGLDLDPEVRILEVCSAPRAKQALETNPDIALLLPCKIVVSRAGGETRIRLARPTALLGTLADPRLEPLAREVEQALAEAVEAAAGA